MAKYFVFGVYILTLNVKTEDKIKNVLVKILSTDCRMNGYTDCHNTYLQIFYKNKNPCGRKMSSDCLQPPDYNQEKTDMMAVNGSSFTFVYIEEMASIKNVVIGITPTSKTAIHPVSMSCEVTRNQTPNGFRIKTRSSDGRYEFELLIEVVCMNSNCSGQKCEICGITYPSKTKTIATTKTTRTTPIKGLPSKLTTTITKVRTIASRHSNSITNNERSTGNTKHALITIEVTTSMSSSSTRPARFSIYAPGTANNKITEKIADILIASLCILVGITLILLSILGIFLKYLP
ncbi:uncharacterized protein LOC143085274 [Mytilus galloprovincialis]|uniref:uncharacterized protein LOC143085274 n=1 Tax=Mytilus galloprovincialis TaxID=29158 RepID=UPI003F7BA16A